MKRILALLLAALMLAGMLVGCGGKTEDKPSTEPTAAPTQKVETPSFEPVEETPDPMALQLPLTEDDVSFDFWMPMGSTFEGFATFDDSVFYQWAEEMTGVHLNFIHPAVGSENEVFQTMVLSEDYPDMVKGVSGYYQGGPDKAVKDGFIITLNDVVRDIMPHYASYIYADEQTFISYVTDEGNLWGVHQLPHKPSIPNGTADRPWIGLGIRQDWLDKSGLTMDDVSTIDGLETALTAFRGLSYESAGPLYLGIGGMCYSYGIAGAYGVGSVVFNNNGMINKEGVAVYSPMEPGFKEYAAKMADWFKKGFINANFISDYNWTTPAERWANSEVGVGEFTYTDVNALATAAAASAVAPDPDFKLVALRTPTLQAGQDPAKDIHLRQTNAGGETTNSVAMTSACKDFELACRYWDFMFTEEARVAENFGPYCGELGDTNATYYIDENDTNGDGVKECWQPWVQETYQIAGYIEQKFGVFTNPGLIMPQREWSLTSPELLEAPRIWSEVGVDWAWPGTTMTADESAEVSTILANCSTKVNEWIITVIMGANSADTFETDLVPTLESMNVQRAVEVYQAALDRRAARAQFIG